MIFSRFLKTLLVTASAVLFTIAAFTSITDYDANWQFARHTLSMDTTFKSASVMWRAITNPAWQTFFYVLIIVMESLSAILLWIAVTQLFRHLNSVRFNQAKPWANAGLGFGILLYFFGFIVIGAEWFMMWQSPYNAQFSAGLYATLLLLILIYLNQNDG
ncbi:DUF2165 family protein [Coxiella burnetii]|uniref:DUF2165 family protein n=1 Tax=Coxiella burnetii TaxID=777 RepID=UPI000592620A|nr:DUF2165 domain-containing protein [Coxiella burnetii]ATN75159.1 hypothetical protein AYM90_09400 [Coxiella burnetii]ATN77068.1 hypothetical protein AYM94_09410 [Coxiella burnetii]ATN78984.1 hypothetical protein AYM93_09405 [Coxiella burnetii]ATN80893.1 hypothetical protein AYN00_09385 [Coxiella burnetii]OYK89505.1 hypothetical protein CbuQ195_09655 [Coxiella burnetii]